MSRIGDAMVNVEVEMTSTAAGAPLVRVFLAISDMLPPRSVVVTIGVINFDDSL
jgi:hypothetical protein